MQASTQASQLRVHSRFHSRFLPNDRDVFVYLPPGYDHDRGRAYPVLYMQDGQNLFESNPLSPRQRTWGFAEAADSSIQADEIEPLIVVGVAHTGEHRLAEYTPTPDWTLGGGLADQYGRLLVEELLPFVSSRYRIRPGAASTGLGGASLGALASLYLGLRYGDTFGKLAVLSPAVWWNHRSILALVDETAPKMPARPRVWLDIGEGEGPRAVGDADLLARKLRAEGWRHGSDLSYRQVQGGTHDEAAWARRVRPMLRFLFPCS